MRAQLPIEEVTRRLCAAGHRVPRAVPPLQPCAEHVLLARATYALIQPTNQPEGAEALAVLAQLLADAAPELFSIEYARRAAIDEVRQAVADQPGQLPGELLSDHGGAVVEPSPLALLAARDRLHGESRTWAIAEREDAAEDAGVDQAREAANELLAGLEPATCPRGHRHAWGEVDAGRGGLAVGFVCEGKTYLRGWAAEDLSEPVMGASPEPGAPAATEPAATAGADLLPANPAPVALERLMADPGPAER